MKLSRWLSAAALSLSLGVFLLGTTALLQAQDQREESKPAQPEAAKPSQQEEHTSRPEDAKHSKQQDSRQQDQETQNAGQPKPGANAHSERTNQQSAEHAQGNGNERRGRIPDDKFRANFGRQHTFAMRRPNGAQGQPTFQYGGYSFMLVDAWPAEWAYTDQCYIDYIDGEYFLFDLAHPGVRLAIVVAL